MKIEFEQQVLDFIGSLAPEPRRRCRLALRALERGSGYSKALGGELDGFHRMRVATYRVIFRYSKSSEGSGQFIHCVFAERREVVYAEFGERLNRPE